MISKEILARFFAAEAKLLNKGFRREIFLFRDLIVKRVYRGYKRAADLNRHEYQNYLKIAARLPPELRANFQEIYGLEEIGEQSYLLCEPIVNADGRPSPSLAEFGPVADAFFWQRLDILVKHLAQADLSLTDLHGKNVLVRSTEEGLAPVIVDYKTLGADFAPWQVDLFFPMGRAWKMYRKYKRMQREFRK